MRIVSGLHQLLTSYRPRRSFAFRQIQLIRRTDNADVEYRRRLHIGLHCNDLRHMDESSRHTKNIHDCAVSHRCARMQRTRCQLLLRLLLPPLLASCRTNKRSPLRPAHHWRSEHKSHYRGRFDRHAAIAAAMTVLRLGSRHINGTRSTDRPPSSAYDDSLQTAQSLTLDGRTGSPNATSPKISYRAQSCSRRRTSDN